MIEAVQKLSILVWKHEDVIERARSHKKEARKYYLVCVCICMMDTIDPSYVQYELKKKLALKVTFF